jgi:hypothetical protein
VLLQLDEAELDAFDPFLVVWIYGTLWWTNITMENGHL